MTGCTDRLELALVAAVDMQLGNLIVPLELRPGTSVPIPCRHCEKALIRFTVSEGGHSVACPRCGGATDVKVYPKARAFKIKTSKGATRVKPPFSYHSGSAPLNSPLTSGR